MNHYHGLLDALGVCDKTLATIVYTLRQQAAVLGAKISGAGLGDCILALGTPDAKDICQFMHIPVASTEVGVRYEDGS